MTTANNYCEGEGPIIDLLKTLASSDLIEMTLLTNFKLQEILENEFGIDTTMMHVFEVDVYITVLKQYLKTWPGWDDFDQNIHRIKTTKDKEDITKILKKEYVKLKEYLMNLLNLTQELVTNKVAKLKENLNKEQIFMEVEATRQQLNNLFYRTPIQNNIFNTAIQHPKRNMKKLTIKSALNWYGVEILIKIRYKDKCLHLEHRNVHKLKHTLVNKKLNLNTHKNIRLDQNILVKVPEIPVKISKSEILEHFEQNPSIKFVFSSILKRYFKKLPDILEVPCSFRRYGNKYRYMRYLYCDVGTDKDIEKYDLNLEEIISPMSEFSLRLSDTLCTLEDSVKILCTECQITFVGNDLEIQILKHFKEKHYAEPDWICMNCSKAFSIKSLTNCGWRHRCTDVQTMQK